ncbi:uncharacterized protein LOC116254735 [Nymphaea colorata]|uniref:uncharacterized protein LOC116254735 n=1 Tax=Nymphaea colorata TaxID=210225 RepID=UPI00129EC4D1|nr:uncharacterized protein LOC116254735 [Nymphaea colorata]
MGVAVISDTSLVSIAQNLLGFHPVKDLLRSSNVSVITDCMSAEAILGGIGAISAGIPPPPAVRLRKLSAPSALSRRMRRAKRRTVLEDDGGDWEEFGGGSGRDDGDGPFGNGKDGGGGGWSFGSGDEGSNADPAFDFVYEVISWLALSQCLQFAFKRFVQLLEDRNKVPEFALGDIFTFRAPPAKVVG